MEWFPGRYLARIANLRHGWRHRYAFRASLEDDGMDILDFVWELDDFHDMLCLCFVLSFNDLEWGA